MTLPPYFRWTDEESAILAEHYYSKGAAILNRTLLPNRSIAQISSRANYLGLSFDKELIGYHARNTEDLSHLIAVREPFHAYMLGFLWADGTVNKRSFCVALKIIQPDWLDIADRWLSTARSWRVQYHSDGHPNHQPQITVAINSQSYHAFLVQCGYLFKSGDSACDILKVVPENFHHYWWRGYFDGDGGFTAHKKTRRVTITACYDQDWSFAERLTVQHGISYSISRQSNDKRSLSNLAISDEANLRRFMEYIYQGESFGLRRKREAYDTYLEYKRTIRPQKTSHYRGVCKDRRSGGWMMQIYKGRYYRARFATETEAALAYDAKAVELFGNKAVLNFPLSS